MLIKNFLFTVIFSALLVSACETQKAGNSSPNTNAAEINRNIKDNTAADESNILTNNSTSSSADYSASKNSNSASDVQTNVDDNADFEGTAGIIDKKNEAKSAALLKAVRSAQHGNYDRVVFEFEAAEMPSYHVEYIDKPVRACGSGNVVPLAGDGWLEIRFSPANAHTEEGKPTVEKREYSPNHRIIKELKSTCDFEADVTWVLGVASPNRYRVLELKNPTRLAIDIKHE